VARKVIRQAFRIWVDAVPTVIASDSEAIQTKPQPQSPSLDRFVLLAMTTEVLRSERMTPWL
jgi:hypothetical protein